MAVTWMKHKYAKHKPASRYRSSHNDSHKKQKKTGGSTGTPGKTPGVRTLVVDAMTGKNRWIWL